MVQLISDNYPKYSDQAKKVQLIDIDAKTYYGEGYQDVELRVPAIRHATEYLAWKPQVDMQSGLHKTLDFYLA